MTEQQSFNLNQSIYIEENYHLMLNDTSLIQGQNSWKSYPFKYFNGFVNAVRSLEIVLPFHQNLFHKKTLFNKYSAQSLAIIYESENQDAAILKSINYHIPLMQICLNQDPLEESLLKQRILLCFEVSHFLNQNFVLYGSWHQHPQISNGYGKSMILFRKGMYVYGSMKLCDVSQVTDDQLLKYLLKARNTYYMLDSKNRSDQQIEIPKKVSNQQHKQNQQSNTQQYQEKKKQQGQKNKQQWEQEQKKQNGQQLQKQQQSEQKQKLKQGQEQKYQIQSYYQHEKLPKQKDTIQLIQLKEQKINQKCSKQ